MGSDSGDSDEQPVHKVYLDAYYMDKYEVTNEQYAKFLNEYGKDTDDNNNKMICDHDPFSHGWVVKKTSGGWQPAPGYAKYPVVYVTWYGANQYAKFYGKRLPTEAEWEKSCGAPSSISPAKSGEDEKGMKYCFGDNESELEDYAWYDKNSGLKTHPVGQKKPNQYGLYDMHANVWEWCSDWYAWNYYKNSPTRNPSGPGSGSLRVLRGGSWYINATDCRSSGRSWDLPSNELHGDYGFRCVVGGSSP